MYKPNLKNALATSSAGIILLLSATACGSDNDGLEKPDQAPTTITNNGVGLVEEDGAVTVDGISYKHGEAYETDVIVDQGSYEMGVSIRWRCVGSRLQAVSVLNWTDGTGSSTDTILDDPACTDGTIDVGELTNLRPR